MAQSPIVQESALPGMPGIPNQPDVVTVIPFVVKPDETALEQTKVVIPVEIDRYRGNVVLDLGAPALSLNRTFLQPSASGGVDTVTDATRIPEHDGWDSVHVTLRIGTLRDVFDDPTMESPTHPHANATLDHQWGNYRVFGPRLGNLSLSALEPFETIIDYTHQRVVLIRLDSAGHRLAEVPAYTPMWSASLIDVPLKPGEQWYSWWGVMVRLGGVADSMFFDTGAPIDGLQPSKISQLEGHLTNDVVDHLIIAGRTFDAVPYDMGNYNILGYPFLHMLGVVGFNHRTHQFILYR